MTSFGWLPRLEPFIHKIAFLAGDVLSEINSLDWSVHKTHKCTVLKGRVGAATVQTAVLGICRMKCFIGSLSTKKKTRL